MRRLCVVSLNPAIDAEWRVDDVLWEEKNVVHSQRRWAGGKGVNVARWLDFLGASPELLMPLGGDTGRELLADVRSHGLRVRVVPLLEATRVNVVVTTAQGRQMRFNPPGPKLSAREWAAVLQAVGVVARSGADLILSGALPRGVPADAYAKLTRLAHRFGRRVFLDCDGEALRRGAIARPFLVKPNLHELSGWAGRRLAGRSAVEQAALALSTQTRGWVLVSLGADGGLLVHAGQGVVERRPAPRARVVNTVGAGDAMLAAACLWAEQGAEPAPWLRGAVEAGSAATRCPAGLLPGEAVRRKLLRSAGS